MKTVGCMLAAALMFAPGIAAAIGFRVLALHSTYVPGGVYFFIMPCIQMVLGMVFIRIFEPRLMYESKNRAGSLLATPMISIALEVCNALRLGHWHGEPYSGAVFWLSALLLYGFMGLRLGLGVRDLQRKWEDNRKRRQLLADALGRLKDKENQLRAIDREINARKEQSAQLSSAHFRIEARQGNVTRAISEIVAVDPANLDLARRDVEAQLRSCSIEELELRSARLESALGAREREQQGILRKQRETQARATLLKLELGAARAELSRLEREDPANVRLMLDRLKEAWQGRTTDELRRESASGVIASRYKTVRLLEHEVEQTAQEAAEGDRSLARASSASLTPRLEALLCDREQLIRERQQLATSTDGRADSTDSRYTREELGKEYVRLAEELSALRESISTDQLPRAG